MEDKKQLQYTRSSSSSSVFGHLKMLKQILSDDSAQEVAIVSHGVLIKSLLCYLENRPLAQLWEPPIMHNCAHSIIATEPNSSAPRILQFAGLAQ